MVLFTSQKELRCPEEFAFNCKNLDILCHKCKANNRGSKIYYKPIINLEQEHPSSKKDIKRVKAGKVFQRKGREDELRLIKELGLKKTINSGSYNNNGDALIDLTNWKNIRIEIKIRYSENNIYNPNIQEVKKGLNQEISLWFIKSKRDINCFMTKKLYEELILENFLLECEKGKRYKTIYIEKGNIYLNYFNENNSEYLNNLIKLDYRYINLKKGVSIKNIKKGLSRLKYNDILIAKTEIGNFVYMSYDILKYLREHIF